MRLSHTLGILLGCAVFATACGDGGGSDRPAPPAPKPAPAPPPAPKPAPKPPPPAGPTAGNAQAGSAHYAAYCATCHGASGQGDGPGAAGLPVSPRDFRAGDFKLDADADGKPGTDADLRLVVENGAGAYGGSALMTPWGGVLDAQAIADVVAYVRSLAK